MRNSDAVKRYKLETKQRILNNVFEAAEKETSAARPSDNSGIDNGTKVIYTEKSGMITMKSTQLNEVKSRKFGAVAAACAILAVGGGIALFSNQDRLPTDDISRRAVITLDSVADDSKNDAPSEDSVAPDGVPTFDELLSSTRSVIAATVESAEPATIVRDGEEVNCIKYVVSGEYEYISDTNELRCRLGDLDSVTIYQPVPDGFEPELGFGDAALFMAGSDPSVEGDVNITAVNGVFVYNSSEHRYVSVCSGSIDVSTALRGFVIDQVLTGRSSSSVANWLQLFGEDADYGEMYSEDYPNDAAIVSWDDGAGRLTVSVNHSPQTQKIQNIIKGEESLACDLAVGDDIAAPAADDSGKLDISLYQADYFPDRTAALFTVSVLPKEGSGVVFNDSTIYQLDYDIEKGIGELSRDFNADAVLASEGCYDPATGGLTFKILLDQYNEDGEMVFDLGRTYSFTLDGVSNRDGSQVIGGETTLSFKVTSDTSDFTHAKIVNGEAEGQ